MVDIRKYKMLNFILPDESNRADVLSFYEEIEKNGGVLENRIFDSDEQVFVKRYWIEK